MSHTDKPTQPTPDAVELLECLKWAMSQLGGEPKLIRRQNDTYYHAWLRAKDAITKAEAISGK